MEKFVDLTGQTFYRLTVIKRLKSKNGKVMWECRCDCGNVVEVAANSNKDMSTYCGISISAITSIRNNISWKYVL